MTLFRKERRFSGKPGKGRKGFSFPPFRLKPVSAIGHPGPDGRVFLFRQGIVRRQRGERLLQPLKNGRLGRTRGRPDLFPQNLAANNGTFLSREQGDFFRGKPRKAGRAGFSAGKLLFGKEDPGNPAETRPCGRIPAGKENDVACRTRLGCRIPA